jgi:hypothetical protein
MTQIDHFRLDDIVLFSSTAVDVIQKYGLDYKYSELMPGAFWIKYASQGLSFLCSDYIANDSMSLYQYCVVYIEITKPSTFTTKSGIDLYSSRLIDVITAHGYPLRVTRNAWDEVYHNYVGLQFTLKHKYPGELHRPWIIDDNLDEPIDSIAVSVDNNHLQIQYQNVIFNRWLRFCSYLSESEWGMLADGSLVYPRMHVFQYVNTGNIKSYGTINSLSFYQERSRLFSIDIEDFDCLYNLPVFSYRRVFLTDLPANAEFQDLSLDPKYPSQKSAELALENFLSIENAQLVDTKRRILEKDFDSIFNSK